MVFVTPKSTKHLNTMSAVWEPTRSSGDKPAARSTSDTKPTAEYISSGGNLYVKLPGMTHAAQVQMDPDTYKPTFMDKELMTAANKEAFAAWDTLAKVENRSMLLLPRLTVHLPPPENLREVAGFRTISLNNNK